MDPSMRGRQHGRGRGRGRGDQQDGQYGGAARGMKPHGGPGGSGRNYDDNKSTSPSGRGTPHRNFGDDDSESGRPHRGGPAPQQRPGGPGGAWAQPRPANPQQQTRPMGPRPANPPQRPLQEQSSQYPRQQNPTGAARSSPPSKEGPELKEEPTRGAVRGRRVISEVIRSKPSTCVSKTGTSGRKIMVHTNYFRINKKPQWSVDQYHVDFSPDVDITRLRRAYLAQHREILGGYIYNGSVLYTCTNLKDKMVNGFLELTTKNRMGEVFLLKIKHVGNVNANETEMLHLLNLILRHSMERLELQQMGRNFFDPHAKVNLNQYNLEIWPGYETSIHQHENDVLLCVDLVHKVLRTDSVYRILNTCIKESKDFQSDFRREISGTVVITDYNNKTYRVMDVDYNTNPLSKFDTKNGPISFAEYYQKRYNINIRDPRQPLLIAESTDRRMRSKENPDEVLLLIPELCRATGITDAMRNNFRLMRAVADETRMKPDIRGQRLLTFNKRLKQSQDISNYLKSWQMTVDEHLVQAPARILDPEQIIFGGGKRYKCDRNADWTREFRETSMYAHVDLTRWIVIVPSRNSRETQSFVEMCMKAARGMRMKIETPLVNQLQDDRTPSYFSSLDGAAAKDPQLIMVIIPSQNEEKYACIKKKLCIDRPIPSQVICARTISPRDGGKGLMSVATKVVIQMNAKILGSPWTVELPLSGLMTVGFDICHSAKDKSKSYGAMVATMDIKKSSKYFSHVTEHVKGQELSNEISLSMSFAVKAFHDTHGNLPERILFYRDGVGDGQLGQVFRTEVQVLNEKLASIYKQHKLPPPKFAFIVVSKRISTRYFVGGDNPQPGTVVDDVITLPERYDFFLVSQSVRQGTVSPTNYNVIYDTFGLGADKIQILSYKMTHLYYNWSGTTRVPAVCQYAHKLASLVGKTLHRAPNNRLQQNLYFL